ncbi:WD repeat-containing protein 36 isoform X1 [Cydia pomonella]|uniref:WD repeat-containing protein 36 isoform X1 n=1 Tax=Cydia pomonella TaxID=82600 RepID=UPI002ADDD567|nr:WD repeat-containing protein 36 isoform X1 [Cydia pomonella]
MAEQSSSRIFTGSKVLGYVSTHVPFVARFIKNRGETLLCTSVGKWFHTYGCNKFRLLTISGQHPGPITCMSGDNFHVYSASNNEVYAWRRGCELKHVYKGHNAPIHLMLPFGIHLITIDKNNNLKVFDIKEESIYLELKFEAEFTVSTICHPPTYLNKILLGSRQGPLQLWNLRTSKLIYTFKGWKARVLVLQPAPAVDVVAIGLTNKKIILHNLRLDQTVMHFVHDWGDVSTLSFRMDGVPVMVTGSAFGHIVMWDLEERRVISTVTSAHSKMVAGMQCLMSEPLMVTNSADNSLKLWIFDMPDGGARLLRVRAGHSHPPNLVWHCEPTGENLLAASNDRTLHIMNTVTETFNKNMGKATYNRKATRNKKRLQMDTKILPPIVKLSSCMQRDKQWDSIATIHKGKSVITTWSYNKIRMGEYKLALPDRPRGVVATCLTVTQCGNFVIIGYDNGQVHKFNMQSGIHRGHYGEVLDKKIAHDGALRGVETDLCNQRVITAGADEKLKFWYFKSTKTPYHVMQLEESVGFTKCHRESALLALANEDFTITLLDIDTMNIVRRFDGHRAKINDIGFDSQSSSQSRWLFSASMDCTLCTWDIPSGHLVDIFSLEKPVTCLSMSPTGDYLATTHVGQLGVCLWANRLLYEKVYLKPIDKTNMEVPQIKLPSTVPEKPSIEDIGTIDIGDEAEYMSPSQISSELITLSNQPTSKWLNLLHLDVVKKRNKPKTPLTVPKSAPFFLPTVASLDLQFDLESEKDNNKETKLLIPESLSTLSVFAKKLVECKSEENFEKCIVKLKSLSPAAIDSEVSCMSPDAGGTVEVLKQFLVMLNVMLRSNRDFELAQSYLSLFLKSHTKTIAENEELRDALHAVEEAATKAWARLQNNLLYNICVVKALKDM